MDKIRVLIVDDSPIARQILKILLKPHADIEVVGEATNGAEALDQVRELRPGVVTMDVCMPEKNGLQAIEEIMAHYPTPILVITSEPQSGVDLCFLALELGALDMIEKSALGKGQPLVDKIRLLSKIPVIRHVGGKYKSVAGRPPAFDFQIQSPATPKKKTVLIGSSAGGPSALVKILKGLSPQLPVPIIIAQHIPAGFSHGFCTWLEENCKWKVREAVGEEVPQIGTVHIAPGGYNLTFQSGGRMCLEKTMPRDFSPSITHMMKSAAPVFAETAIGILLTGIGDDGAEGLLEIRRAGGHTIAEDASTCLVFGMPRKAIELGAAEEVLPCHAIAAKIATFCGSHR